MGYMGGGSVLVVVPSLWFEYVRLSTGLILGVCARVVLFCFFCGLISLNLLYLICCFPCLFAVLLALPTDALVESLHLVICTYIPHPHPLHIFPVFGSLPSSLVSFASVFLDRHLPCLNSFCSGDSGSSHCLCCGSSLSYLVLFRKDWNVICPVGYCVMWRS